MLFSFLKANAQKAVNRSDKMAGVNATLKFLDDEGLYPDFHAIESGVNEAECVVDGKKYLMFCSNNYLSLSENPEVKKAAQDAIEKYGVGPGGSRVISGDVTIIRELEAAIADLVGKEACLTFPTGYMANVAVFQALMDPLFYDMPAKSSDGVIFSDENNHGSIIDGCRLSKAKKVIFKHNDLEDLERKIKENDLPNKLIVTEGVYSLEGEITNIAAYSNIAKLSNSKLMVDDAHGVGILGINGGGTPQLFGCSKGVDIIMGSLDKALGGIGGYLCGSRELVKLLRVSSRSSILSSAYPIPVAGGMLKAIELVKNYSDERTSLFENARRVKAQLNQLGLKTVGEDNLPAIAVHIGEDKTGISFSKRLWEQGIMSPVFRWPAVPEKQSRLRLTIMKSHSEEHLNKLVSACAIVGKELSLI